MRAGIEVFARRWWSGRYGLPGRVLTALAMPASWAWAAAARSDGRRRAADAIRVEGLTVISVGNLAVGGTGKTPFVSWLARRLSAGARNVAVLVGEHAPDEARLHAVRLPGVSVLENRDRVAGAMDAARHGCSVAVLDDGFQHRRLARDLDVVLLSAEDPFPAPVLPAGPYREAAMALRRADVVVVTRRSAAVEESRALAARVHALAPEAALGAVELAAAGWQDVEGRAAKAPAGDVLAVCGVGRPDAFRASVERMTSGTVETVAFADHHVYTPADVAALKRKAAGRPIVTTEKDAVKLRSHAGTGEGTYVLAEEVRWDWGEDALVSRLKGLGVPAGSG